MAESRKTTWPGMWEGESPPGAPISRVPEIQRLTREVFLKLAELVGGSPVIENGRMVYSGFGVRITLDDRGQLHWCLGEDGPQVLCLRDDGTWISDL